MPYQRDGTCVYKENPDGSRGEQLKCFDTIEDADAYLAALYANVGDAKALQALRVVSRDESPIAFGGAIKALQQGTVGGYLILWGSPEERDLQGEYFTTKTFLGLDWFPSRPALYHHGLDMKLGDRKIGTLDVRDPDDIGVWAETQLDMHNKWVQAVWQLASRGIYGYSSGTLPHLAKTNEDGQIIRWPLIEGSLTPVPAEFRGTTVRPTKSYFLPFKALRNLPMLEGLATKGADGEGTAPASDMSSPPPGGESPAATGSPEEAVEPPPDGERPIDAAAETPGAEPIADAAAEAPEAPPPPDESPTPNDSQESSNMDPKEVVSQTIAAVLQALGITDVTEEQQAQLAQSVLDSLQPPSQDAMRADPTVAATFGEQAGKAAIQVVQDYVAQQAAIKAAAGAVNGQHLTPQSRVPDGYQAPGQTHQVTVYSKYHDLSGPDMAFLETVMSRTKGLQMSQPFWRELADKVEKEAKKGDYPYLELDYKGDQQPIALKAVQRIKKFDGLKANEFMGTAQAGAGQEWTPDLWSSDLWRKARNENVLLSLLPMTDMPSNPYHMPTDGADPTVYRVAATTDDSQLNPASSPVTVSQAATDNKDLVAYKLGARVNLEEELNEDSIIPMIPELRQKMLFAMEDAMEEVVLHAHSLVAGSPSGNINRYDAATLVTDKDKWLLGFDGIAVLPLVDNTDNGYDHNGAMPTTTMFRRVKAKLSPQYMTKQKQLVYVVDPILGNTLLDMQGVQTLDKLGPKATLVTGQLASIDNIPIVSSDHLPLAASNGMLSDTDANNIYGRLLVLYRDAFRVGYRRRVSVEVVRFPLADGQVLVAFVRIAFVRRDDDCAAMGYNVKVLS